jgi:hypothetical protein
MTARRPPCGLREQEIGPRPGSAPSQWARDDRPFAGQSMRANMHRLT